MVTNTSTSEYRDAVVFLAAKIEKKAFWMHTPTTPARYIFYMAVLVDPFLVWNIF